MSRIVMIDDDRALCRSVQLQIEAQGHEVHPAYTGQDGLALCRQVRPDLILLDLKLPDMSGLDVLSALKKELPPVPVVLITGTQDMKAAIEAMREGAFDYLRKPFETGEILLALEKSQRFRRLEEAARRGGETLVPPAEELPAGEIIGRSRAVLEVIKQIGRLARHRDTVLVTGESGTGKELVARALHEASTPERPFLAINCSAIVTTLPESELFGHEKGAFTGAVERKRGKLEVAGEGTLFLDEIGDLPLELQGKLLRVLQEREFERVGGIETLPMRARVLAATHQNLEARVRDGRFRQDLFFRIAVAQLHVPPLRERGEDVLLLAEHFLGRLARRLNRRVIGLSSEARQALLDHPWPGNVRELENVLAKAVTISPGGVLTAEDLRPLLNASGAVWPGGTETVARPEMVPRPEPAAWPETAPDRETASLPGSARENPAPPGSLDERGTGDESAALFSLAEAERRHLARVFAATGGNVTHTARILEISPTTLRKKLLDYGLRD